MINYQKVKIKNNIIRGSLFSVSDMDYKNFILKSKELTIIKINDDRILLQNEFQENNWFYKEQLERII